MNANPGDLVVCVDVRPIPTQYCVWSAENLTRNATYRVLDTGVDPDDGSPIYHLNPSVGEDGALQCRFRKIRPDEHEDCEPEFVELLKRSKVKA
jgi:hypothetical protein